MDGNAASTTSGSTAASSSVQVLGVYRITDSPDYTWITLQSNGRYATWPTGDACNKDVSHAPTSCLATGGYVINTVASEIQFTDDATGKVSVSSYQVTAVGPASGTVTTMNTGGSGGGGSGNGGDGSGDSQKPVATAMNVGKCVLAAIACAFKLYTQEPSPEKIQPPPPPPIMMTQEPPTA
jgi:hypothetical protein